MSVKFSDDVKLICKIKCLIDMLIL